MRIIIKHDNKYFVRTALDEETINKLKSRVQCYIDDRHPNIVDMVYSWHKGNYGAYKILDRCVDIITKELRNIFIEAPDDLTPLFSDQREPDQYIGFDDIKLEVEKELKDQYINNQKKIQEKLEQQIKDYEDKYQKVDEEFQSKYDIKIKSLEEKLNSKQEEVDKLNESHKEEVNKLKEELKEAQKTQEEKILDAETKLKEAQEALNKLTNNSRKKWYQFWK